MAMKSSSSLTSTNLIPKASNFNLSKDLVNISYFDLIVFNHMFDKL